MQSSNPSSDPQETVKMHNMKMAGINENKEPSQKITDYRIFQNDVKSGSL